MKYKIISLILGVLLILTAIEAVGNAQTASYYKAQVGAFIGCGDVSTRVLSVLKIYDIPCRQVQVVTNEPFDGIYDGHVLTEIYLDEKWIAYDALLNCFLVSDDKYLSAKEGCEAIQSSSYDLVPLSSEYQHPMLNDTAWLKRVYQKVVP